MSQPRERCRSALQCLKFLREIPEDESGDESEGCEEVGDESDGEIEHTSSNDSTSSSSCGDVSQDSLSPGEKLLFSILL